MLNANLIIIATCALAPIPGCLECVVGDTSDQFWISAPRCWVLNPAVKCNEKTGTCPKNCVVSVPKAHYNGKPHKMPIYLEHCSLKVWVTNLCQQLTDINQYFHSNRLPRSMHQRSSLFPSFNCTAGQKTVSRISHTSYLSSHACWKDRRFRGWWLGGQLFGSECCYFWENLEVMSYLSGNCQKFYYKSIELFFSSCHCSKWW